MPVNYQQIQNQFKGLGRQAREREQRLQSRRAQALALLRKHASNLQALRDLVERAGRENTYLRCAVPLDEVLTSAFPCPPTSGDMVIIAADGSQIAPDRHSALEFGVINTGALRIQPEQPVAPTEIVETELLFGDQVRVDGILISDEVVALRRDLAERSLLADLAARESLPVVTLTDGPIELYRDREPGAVKLYREYFQDYLKALEKLCSLSAVTAGYVDRPGSDLVVRLLELTLFPEEDFPGQAGQKHPLQGVTDASLYFELLKPGDRSPLFAIKSPSARNFEGDLALHYFLLNVGRENDPYIGRVEIPAWVASHPVLLDRLHGSLVAQCRITGTHPFPYALHRAHEVAVVTLDEKAQLEGMLMKALIEQGFAPGHISNKQFLKDNFGKRTRYIR